MSKSDLFAKLKTTDAGAPLKEEQPKRKLTKTKLLNAMPIAYFNAHDKGRESGKISLDFSSYIYEAVKEKLIKDGMI